MTFIFFKDYSLEIVIEIYLFYAEKSWWKQWLCLWKQLPLLIAITRNTIEKLPNICVSILTRAGDQLILLLIILGQSDVTQSLYEFNRDFWSIAYRPEARLNHSLSLKSVIGKLYWYWTLNNRALHRERQSFPIGEWVIINYCNLLNLLNQIAILCYIFNDFLCSVRRNTGYKHGRIHRNTGCKHGRVHRNTGYKHGRVGEKIIIGTFKWTWRWIFQDKKCTVRLEEELGMQFEPGTRILRCDAAHGPSFWTVSWIP